MNIKSVPQDDSATYAKMEKVLYASDEEGKLKSVASTGWDIEEIVTQQAVDDIEDSIRSAYEEVKSGKKSPLYYHMFAARMDLLVLAQSTGFFRWTIKKHFKPTIFKKLSDEKLLEYCDVLGLSLDEIKKLPEAEDE